MRKYYIADIDREVNGSRLVALPYALRKIVEYITDKIDPTFPEKQFKSWVDSDAEKPFRWNSNSYHWQ